MHGKRITRQPATHAIVQGTFKPTDWICLVAINVEITIIQLKNRLENGVYEMVCETAGSLPNGFLVS